MFGDHLDAGKSSFYRSSSDIPMIVKALMVLHRRWWQTQPGQVSDALVGLTDILPTLVAATGTPVPDDIDGHDLGPIIRGEQETAMPVFKLLWRH